jgi:hypothetical protein
VAPSAASTPKPPPTSYATCEHVKREGVSGQHTREFGAYEDGSVGGRCGVCGGGYRLGAAALEGCDTLPFTAVGHVGALRNRRRCCHLCLRRRRFAGFARRRRGQKGHVVGPTAALASHLCGRWISRALNDVVYQNCTSQDSNLE